MKILFGASRHAGPEHRQAISDALLSVVVCTKDSGPHTLVHGDGRGGDQIAAALAREWGWFIQAFTAQWDAYGRSAGPRRTQLIVAGGGDQVVAMPDERGLDSGTGTLIRLAVAAGLPVNVRPLRIEEARLL